MTAFLDICEQAARAGGAILLDWQGRITPQQKGPKDLVTEADFASQKAIRDLLLDAFPEHAFLGEEDTGDVRVSLHEFQADRDGYCWIVDPLDGTVNYVHRLQTFAVSIGLYHQGRVIAGVVYDPIMDDCFAAEEGQGATLNGAPLHTSSCRSLGESLVATSLPAHVERDSADIDRCFETIFRTRAFRRLGSAALNMCYVAAGRLDAYWASSVKSWDVAAGELLVREAGGTITGIDGQPFDLCHPLLVASATTELHTELLEMLAAADQSRR